MANEDNGKRDKIDRNRQAPLNQDFDIDADISRLKRSSYVLIVLLVVLVAAFFILMILSLSGSFESWNATNVPAIAEIASPAKDDVVVYREPSIEGARVGLLKLDDRLYLFRRAQGFARVEWGVGRTGWVEVANVRSKEDSLAAFWALASPAVDVVLKVDVYQQDILIEGQVVNKAERPIRKVTLTVAYLDAKRQKISEETITVGTQQDIPVGGSMPFKMIAKGLVNRCALIVWEISDFESDHPPPPPSEEGATPTPEP